VGLYSHSTYQSEKFLQRLMDLASGRMLESGFGEALEFGGEERYLSSE